MSLTFKLTGRKKDKLIIYSNTGPGSYDLPDTKTKLGTRIGPAHRERISEEDEAEGFLSPFTYNPPRCFDEPTGQGYSLGARSNSNDHDDGKPGPGSY